jgi:hypothetical protein
MEMLSKAQEKTIEEAKERVSAQGAHTKRCEDALIEAERANELALASISTVREAYVNNPKRSAKTLESVLVEPRRKAAEAELAVECARHDLDVAELEQDRLAEVARTTEIGLLRELISDDRITSKYKTQTERLVGLRRELRLLTKDVATDVTASRKVSDRLRELGAEGFTWATAVSVIATIAEGAYEPSDLGSDLLAATTKKPAKVWTQAELDEVEQRRQWIADAPKREAQHQLEAIRDRERFLREKAEREAKEKREREAAARAKAQAEQDQRDRDVRLGIAS